ncbi:MAG: anaerobic glycerol-3-phosphate dehydrogenase subunit B [Deltaproteobacteria bacterium]|nr:anaerobic glycerol-3-phosphate dehydrogenase subunit B [Deltaproteobacteria bacterium]
MNSGTYDAVVIGGGMSGLTAAITLCDAGKTVAVVSKGDPVCCLSTGCIDILNSADNPLQGISALPSGHPYGFVGQDAIIEAHERFIKIGAEWKIPYIGAIHESRQIVTPLGTRKTTCLIPKTMEYAAYDESDYIHIVSFKGLKDFYPSYIITRHGNAGHSVFDAAVPSTIGIAERFEDERFRETFAEWIIKQNIPEGKIALPAVLGIRSSLSIYEELSRRTERTFFEIPTLPPSLPGIRLFNCLKKALLARGGRLYWGNEIASIEKLGASIEGVTLKNPGRVARVQGKAFILATGSFVSGGLFARMDSVHETVFDLPVSYPEKRSIWFKETFFSTGHQIEKAGVEIDSSFRPLDGPFENLFVCGSIIARSEVMKYGCGHGMAIATGYAAARSCEGFIT